MNCNNVQARISAYLDNELSGREMLALRAHLSACPICTEELRCVQVVKHLVSSVPVPGPSADFEERLVSRVLAVPPLVEKRLSLAAFTGIAAVSMLATIMLLNLMRTPAPAALDGHEDMATQIMRRDRAFSASSDPLIGSPVMFEGR